MKGPISIVNEGKLRLPISSLVPFLLLTVFVSLPFIQAAATPINNRKIKLDDSNIVEESANQISVNFLEENGHISRQRRELRSPRKIEDAPAQMQKPTNYPFIMAEMVPGSVKTRHPSIIAINNCPAFYIADHEGKCKQVFQYTVNFGQNSPKFNQRSFQPSRNLFDSNNRFSSNFLSNSRNIPSFLSDQSRFGIFRQPSTASTESPITTTTPLVNKYIPPPATSVPPLISPRLLEVLRTAAKKRLDFLVNSASNNSGESNDTNSDLDNLRKRILEALKSSSDKESSSMDKKKNDKNWNDKKSNDVKDEPEVKTTTVDYDD